MKSLWTWLPVVMLSGAALAVTPGEWTHTTEAHFTAGKVESTVVTSLGEVALARKISILLPADAAPPVVSATAMLGKTLYAASGAAGDVVKVDRRKATPFAKVPGAMVCCLLAEGKGLLAGTGGDKAGIYRIDAKGKVVPVWVDAAVRYVWAIVPGPRGVLYAATGPEGKVFTIAAGEADVAYEAGKAARNILCLVRSPKSGLLYAGTDQDGLVVEIDPLKNTSRILLDTAEKEISSLVLDDAGGLYAAGSDVSVASDDGDTKANGEKKGKADRSGRPAAEAAAPSATSAPSGKSARRRRSESAPAAPDRGNGETPAAPRILLIRKPSGKPSGDKPPKAPSEPAEKGNAVYYIAPDGLVRTLFRKPVTILDMKRSGDRLILATGNGGDIYSVTLDGDEVAPIAKTDAKQVTALSLPGDGRIVFGTANKGSVGVVEKGFAREGTFTSEALDAKQIARWGTVRVSATVPGGAKLAVATRSGNVAKPDDKTWSDWSKEQKVTGGFMPVASQAARFLQYRLKFSSAGASPVASQVRLVYQVDNLRPVVSGVKVSAGPAGPGGEPKTGPKTYRNISIQARDPNGDTMRFAVAVRAVGGKKWITIAEKLDKPLHVWDTRTVGDGTYELRVTAGDSPANPPTAALEAARISEPVVVDNTSPLVEKLAAAAGARKALVTGTAVDATSRIVSIHYSVDSATEWVTVLPADGIADSNREKFTFEAANLDRGPHRIAVRVVDVLGNVGYAVVTVEIKQ